MKTISTFAVVLLLCVFTTTLTPLFAQAPVVEGKAPELAPDPVDKTVPEPVVEPVVEKKIEPPVSPKVELPKVGQVVAAPWGSGLYLATVKTIGDGTAEILYHDDKIVRKINLEDCITITTKTWQLGDEVLAVWSSGKFYMGIIVKIEKDQYSVEWADGSPASLVSADRILQLLPPQGMKEGEPVVAPWGDGFYLGSVTELKTNWAYVYYEDDGLAREVLYSHIKRIIPRKWKVGDLVLAVWSTGRFYKGTIVEVKPNDTYSVQWDDGSAPSDVVTDKIIPR